MAGKVARPIQPRSKGPIERIWNESLRCRFRAMEIPAGQAAPTDYERSDFCAVPRAGVVGEAMVCLVLADALLEKLGGDSLDEMRPRFESLRRARLDDLAMLNQPTVFWP